MALTQEQARQALGSLLCAATAAGLRDAEDVVGELLVGVARGDVQSGPAEHAPLEIAEGILTAAYGVVAALSRERGACAWQVLPEGGEDVCVVCGAATRWCSRCSACLAFQEQIRQGLGGGELSVVTLWCYLARRTAVDGHSRDERLDDLDDIAPPHPYLDEVLRDMRARGEVAVLRRGTMLRRAA